ncbi:MAG: DUF6268 family outer membrane beta-barrel protein [Rubrivivax sp.]|jgi:hypothetical protein|nr:DUF6268 family outer membrane beta-barrel protein [Rubrivivax sp.]
MSHPLLRGLAAALLGACGAAIAQPQGGPSGPSVAASITPVWLGTADLDGGGEVESTTLIARLGLQWDLGAGRRAGIAANVDRTSYDFTAPAAFGGVAPWDEVWRYGLSAPLAQGLPSGWVLSLAPSVDWILEDGADRGEALVWGAVATATRLFGDGNRLGFGLGVFDRLGETAVFPLILVDWKLGDRWRLLNPLPAGPTGPAGLELDYRVDDRWSLGVGAAWRSTRFRLRDDGPVPGGVGEERGVPVFLRSTHRLGPTATLNLYAGAVTAGRLVVEDAGGATVREVDAGTAPIVAATLSARF